MFGRLVHSGIKSDSLSEIKDVFDNKIIPRYENVPGCLHICVIIKEPNHDEAFALILWDSFEHLEAFMQSGIYRKNLEDIEPYLSGSSEQKIQLSKDMKLEFVTVPEEPEAKSFKSLAQTDPKIPPQVKTYLTNFRFVSVKIRPGKMEEFRHIYAEKIIPALRDVEGFRYAYLTESITDENEIISITVWDSREAADEYERSGRFDELVEKAEHTFAGLYQWKRTLEKESGKQAVTSEDLKVEYYSVLTGKSFSS